MKFTLVAMAPPAETMDVLCDHTCDLAADIDHVQSAALVSRRIDGDRRVVCVQRWRARADVPDMLRPHLEPGLLDWMLTFERLPGALDCRWHTQSAARQLSGNCRGTLAAAPAIGGCATRLELRCEFATTHDGLRTILGRLLVQHWRRLVEAAARRAAPSRPED